MKRMPFEGGRQVMAEMYGSGVDAVVRQLEPTGMAQHE
jgi:hypothetical protein